MSYFTSAAPILYTHIDFLHVRTQSNPSKCCWILLLRSLWFAEFHQSGSLQATTPWSASIWNATTYKNSPAFKTRATCALGRNTMATAATGTMTKARVPPIPSAATQPPATAWTTRSAPSESTPCLPTRRTTASPSPTSMCPPSSTRMPTALGKGRPLKRSKSARSVD